MGHDLTRHPESVLGVEVPVPFSPERMKPLSTSTREGRVNPKGIPCLYLATNKETAVAEVRPWVGLYVSVAQFKTLKGLTLIDCSVEHAKDFVFYVEEPDEAERDKAVWANIDRAFSEPLNPDESTADYAPTQIIAEAFRRDGIDGIMYKSALGEGLNIALFDINAADLMNCSLYMVKSVSFKFDETANPYFVKKHYADSGKSNA